MQRLRLYDIRLSDFPQLLGLPQGDTYRVSQAANKANRRLLYCKEAGNEGWHGTWAEIAFSLSRTTPYVTLPREIARIEQATVCNRPIQVQNQFFEYLRFGNGRLPKLRNSCFEPLNAAYSRNNAITFVDLSNTPQFLKVYITNPADASGPLSVLFQGVDENGNVIYSQDGPDNIQGEYVTLASPFAASTNIFSKITGIQKDITAGPIQIFQVDPTTAAEVLLLTMEPGEQTSGYRRYYFDNLPCSCCPPTPGPTPQAVTVTAMAKLDFIPMVTDTDYSLIQNLEAIILEGQSARLDKMDSPASKQQAAVYHRDAVRLLNGELVHYLGIDKPAVLVQPFGSARLARQRIGLLR